MSYTLTQKEYSHLKGRLTKARNKVAKAKTPDELEAACKKVIAECEHAERVFEEKGYPDFWSRWVRAKEDAQYSLRGLRFLTSGL